MKKNIYLIALLISVPLLFNSCKDDGNEPGKKEPGKEFSGSGAKGGGAEAVGGRGGIVVVVTSLGDGVPALSHPGTLRWALSQPSPKIIIFNVAGRIRLVEELKIRSGNITIMGQSAPGDGIVITDYPVKVEADNVIIRFLRFRMGDWSADNDNFESSAADALEVKGRKNIMIDHCSFSWSMDECATFYDNTNFTLQYSFITESLKASNHPKGNHGYGGIWGGTNATFYHNLLAHHDSRNPRFNGDRFTGIIDNEKVDFRNNVIYNWGGRAGYAGEGGFYNMINNYYKQGPDSETSDFYEPDSDPSNGGNASRLSNTLTAQGKKALWGKYYINGNTMERNTGVINENYDWTGVSPRISSGRDEMANTPDNRELIKSRIKLSSEVLFENKIHPYTAQQTYDRVLEKAGASLKRDAVDSRIVTEVQTGTGKIIDTQADTPGLPSYTGTREPDVNRDGIPDSWEEAQGVAKGSIDAKASTLSPPYTNLEVYLNDIVKHLY